MEQGLKVNLNPLRGNRLRPERFQCRIALARQVLFAHWPDGGSGSQSGEKWS